MKHQDPQQMALSAALTAVRRHGLAPFTRLIASMPKSYFGPKYANWLRRQEEITAEVKAQLEAAGAVIKVNDGYRRGSISIEFGGVKAWSTIGLYRTLKHWEQNAEKALGRAGRGRR